MRSMLSLATLAATAVATGCTERVEVSSASAPTLNTSPYHTFAMMSATTDSSRPDSTVAAFSGRGYTESANPDFLVAYYGGTGDIIKAKAYPYGYSGVSNVAQEAT